MLKLKLRTPSDLCLTSVEQAFIDAAVNNVDGKGGMILKYHPSLKDIANKIAETEYQIDGGNGKSSKIPFKLQEDNSLKYPDWCVCFLNDDKSTQAEIYGGVEW